VVTVAVGAALMQYAVPAVVPVLQRDLDAMLRGQWWRLGSPLLVQTLGWHQVVANLVTLALFALIAEWLVGRRRWWILFAAGTIGGQIIAYALGEPGGGDSIAICGLAGGVAVALLAGREPAPPWYVPAVVLYVAALAGWGFGGAVAAGAAVGCGAVVLYGLRGMGVRTAERVALAGTMLVAAAMSAVRDLHGVSFLSGAAAMVAVITAERLTR
jgi:membrane associated rhomboid family serine protease